MVWKPRVCGEEQYHHIYAWGNDRHPIFKARAHYTKYLSLLAKYSHNLSVFVVAYALMEYHVHLFVYDRDKNISEFMKKLHGDYAKYFNRVNNRTSHVFGERFNNKIVQANLYGKWLSRYIHRQAVEGGIVNDPIEYEWTSYGIYIGIVKGNWVRPNIILEQFGDGLSAINNYKKFVLDIVDDPIIWSERKTVFDLNVICEHVCNELKISRDALFFPKGHYEKTGRYEFVKILIHRYNVKLCEVAAFLKIQRCTLYDMLK
jgi:REP element-mobilizing transposase RayT